MSRKYEKLIVGDAVKTSGTRSFKKLGVAQEAKKTAAGRWRLNSEITPASTTVSYSVTVSAIGLQADGETVSVYTYSYINLFGSIPSPYLYFSPSYFNISDDTESNFATSLSAYWSNVGTYSSQGTSGQVKLLYIVPATSGLPSGNYVEMPSEYQYVEFDIIGGEDVENPDLIAWLKANATRVG